jgi:hypothetical protein
VPKMSETWQGFSMDSAANLLSFSRATHTNDLGNHSNGYGHSKQHSCGDLADCRKLDSSTASKLRNGFRINVDYDF